MADFDDYFGDDDFVLDEAVEAALAATERQYATQTQQPGDRPVPKRQRTSTSGWTAGLGGRSDSNDDLGSYPEITVQGNGYQALAPNESIPGLVSTRTPAYNSSRLNPPQRQPQRNTPAPQPLQRPTTSNYRPQPVSRVSSVSHAQTRTPSPAAGLHPMEIQLQQLRQQLEEQNRSISEIQAKYQDALEAKTRKEGEVSILRKTIEKHTQEHSAELLRLRSARQESEAKQMQMQKTLREDMERLKTQLLFKQQELEAALRKPPGSVRPKKGPREAPATPLPSSSTKGWTLLSQRPNFTVDVQQTPSRMLFKPPPRMVSPKKSSGLKSPSKPKTLPGFQNSFTTSTPVGLKSKGKERRHVKVDEGNVFNAPLLSQPLLRPSLTVHMLAQNERPPQEPSFRPSSPPPVDSVFESQTQTFDRDGDIVMGAELQQEELEEEYDAVESPNWKAELCRLILTHVRPGCSQLSFQHLLSVAFNGEDEYEDFRLYTTAYMGILNDISHPMSMEGYDLCLTGIASSFTTMVEVLASHKLKSQLSSLLDLLSTLTFFLPKFRSSIIGQDDSPASSPLTRPLCEVITTCLCPKQGCDDDLWKSILSFLETLAFELNDEDAYKLSDLVRNRGVIDTLLHSAQPNEFLEQVSRILVLLAIRKPLCWALLSLPDPTQVESEGPTQRNGLTERLCAYLVDPTREAPEFYTFKENIVTYFAQLSLAAPEAFTHLGNHPLHLASILWHTSLLTAPLYEDDERLMKSACDSRRLIQYISQAVYFIYHLMVRDTPSGSLRHKLQQAPPRPFNNLHHVFIVAFGRLVYSPGPDWLEERVRNQLVQLKDMSLWIFNEVVGDGPELDVIASAYNDEPTRSQRLLDEGEMEAEMVEAEFDRP